MMHTILTRRARLRATAAVAIAALLTACGGDPTPTPPVVPGTLAVALSPAALTVAPGAGGNTTATITRGGDFAGEVTLAATGLPTGVTVAFGSATLAAGVTSTTVTVSVASGTASGTNPIAITASGTGVTVAAATLTLTVSASPTPTVALTVAPTTTSIVAGASGTANATIARGGGFADSVVLTATGAPAGMTLAFTPATIAAGGTTSAIAITVARSVAAGNYPVTINAAGAGVAAATTTLTVTVTAPAGGSAVTLSYCAADAPVWVAYQDGTGPWTRVTPNSGTNTYQFTISAARAGIAAVDTVGSAFDLNITYATAAELNGFGDTRSFGACGAKRVNGTVANVAATQLAVVTLGYATKFVTPLPSADFTLTGVAAGPQDLFAARLSAATQRTDKVILRRGLDIADNGSLALLDFNAAEAFAPVSANVTVSGLGADTASIVSLFNGVRGSAFGFISTIGQYVSGASPYDALPGARLNTDELQQLLVTTTGTGAASQFRSSGVFFRSPTDRTVAMGPALSAPTVARIAGGTYSRASVQLSVQTEYNRYITAEFSQTSPVRSTSIFASSGYTGGGAWDLSIPDLSAAAGWLPTWGLQNGAAISWSVQALGGSVYLLDTAIADGSTSRSASRSSTTPLP
jgi:hypothetical protein